MATFLALYRGETISSAKLVAVTSDPIIVAEFAGCLLQDPAESDTADPVLLSIEQGRQQALRHIVQEGWRTEATPTPEA